MRSDFDRDPPSRRDHKDRIAIPAGTVLAAGTTFFCRSRRRRLSRAAVGCRRLFFRAFPGATTQRTGHEQSERQDQAKMNALRHFNKTPYKRELLKLDRRERILQSFSKINGRRAQIVFVFDFSYL